ncbi:armadillo-type protein [Diplogelasinospora grovesii]|uniref:Armadillo-type protein n=1 Tax=Diplogelasinospora grovesii TaxID=303347 RepID=A0AAN6N6D5_9PEZI|nr:armadillo-type protein [Diplogelasinospora grovesii]
MEQIPLPSSLGEVEALINALYQPNPPETISRIQDVLHRLQRSPEGWQLAQSLIANPNNNIKFFAALTLIVKLNRDSDGMSEDDAKELLQKVIGWFLQSLVDGSGAFVTKKLCTALVTYFMRFSQLWPHPLRHLLYSLDIGRGMPVEGLDDALPANVIVGNLDRRKLRAAIWFTASLVEEITKTDMNVAKYMPVHKGLQDSVADATCLLARGFSPPSDNPALLTQEDALTCFQSWVMYWQRGSAKLGPLVALVDPAMQCFADESLFSATAELFSDILSYCPSFLSEENYNSLAALFDSAWAADHYKEIVDGHEDGNIAFGLLMLAYGDAKVLQLMTGTDDRSQRFLQRLSGLLAAEGYPVHDDYIFVPALEFWSTFVETMIDEAFTQESDHASELLVWRPLAEQHLTTVLMNCWRKIQWPPVETFASWDSAERTGFTDARKDVGDLLQSVFALKGLPLVKFFVDLLLRSLELQIWPEVEACAYCLGSLSDCVSDSSNYDIELGRVFASPLFELLGEQRGPLPLRLRQTGLSLIERYSEYFERHAEYLPHALNLLFAAVGDAQLGGPSAKAISTLCSSCRPILTSEAPTFIRHYQTIRTSGLVLDSLAEERIVLAIASIIQAIPDKVQKMQAFGQLLSFFTSDIERAVQLKANPGMLNLSDPNFLRGVEQPSSAAPSQVPPAEEIALQIALRALRCLSSMAKGMQDVKDHVVDIDDDDSQQQTKQANNAELVGVQATILAAMLQTQETFASSGEVVEIICMILKAGFSETEPGPFVFPAEVVVDFFLKQGPATPRLGTVLSTACSFVGSLYRGPRMYVPNHLSRLLPWVISILQALPEPESDTEVAQNGIYFVDRVMTKYPAVFFGLQPFQTLEFFFMFCLKVLNGKEPLPKSAAADFWTSFITSKTEDDPALQATITGAIEHLGPLLAISLMQNFGGNAARSELDKLSEPLKKLVTGNVHAQMWLQNALQHETFPAHHVPLEQRIMLLKKIIALRGNRDTNKVLREFWLLCRGANFSYAS